MKSKLKYSYLLLGLLLCVGQVFAQDEEGKSLPQKEKEKLRLAVRFGTDVSVLMYSTYLTYIQSAKDIALQHSEYGGDLMINNLLFLTADFGVSQQNRQNREFVVEPNTSTSDDINVVLRRYSYQSKGPYARFGIDFNLLHRSTLEDAVFVGARYGFSSFSHRLDFDEVEEYWYDPIIGDNTNGYLRVSSMEQKKVTANWFELVAGFKAHVIFNFYVTSTLRLKFINQVNNDSDIELFDVGANTNSEIPFEVNDIPGFGLNRTGTRFGFNWGILYKIPVLNAGGFTGRIGKKKKKNKEEKEGEK